MMSMQDTGKKGGGSGALETIGKLALGPIGYKLITNGGLGGLIYDELKGDKKKKRDAAGNEVADTDTPQTTMRRGGKVKKMAKGGSASSRADGIARKGKTKGRMV